jgi:hypothetical protein
VKDATLGLLEKVINSGSGVNTPHARLVSGTVRPAPASVLLLGTVRIPEVIALSFHFQGEVCASQRAHFACAKSRIDREQKER